MTKTCPHCGAIHNRKADPSAYPARYIQGLPPDPGAYRHVVMQSGRRSGRTVYMDAIQAGHLRVSADGIRYDPPPSGSRRLEVGPPIQPAISNERIHEDIRRWWRDHDAAIRRVADRTATPRLYIEED